MNVTRYKERLIELEASLSSRTAREVKSGRDQLIDTAADAGDESVADEAESEDFTEAQLDATILQQVQAGKGAYRQMQQSAQASDRLAGIVGY